MERDRLLLGLTAVFAGLTALLVVTALAIQPFLLVVALPFGATTYLLWYHASGRLQKRMVEQARQRQAGRHQGRRQQGQQHRAQSRWARQQRRQANQRDQANQWQANQQRQATAQSTSGLSRHEAYRILGLDPGASAGEIKRAYRAKVKEVHPDTESGDEDTFKRVSRAYQTLADE